MSVKVIVTDMDGTFLTTPKRTTNHVLWRNIRN